MPVNASPEFVQAEKKYHEAATLADKIACLEEMISLAPAHKSGENIRANLKTRLKKLKEKAEDSKKRSGSTKYIIKKSELQAALIGLTNSGKSSLLSALTNATPQIASYLYTTQAPNIGTLEYDSVKIQLIDLPAVEHETFDQGVANTADVLIILLSSLEEMPKIMPFLSKSIGKKILVFNKCELLTAEEKRKLEAQLKTKKLDFILVSALTKENLSELKKRIWESFGKIRIYTKQPSHPPDKDPIIFPPETTIKEVAEKVFHGLSSNVIEAKVTGPSAKFPNQKVGLDHVVKDKDIVEFKTR